MVDPQKDVPKSVIRSAIATVILYSLPIFGILVVLPTDKIKGIDGFVGAVNAVFGDVYGGAAHMLVKFMVGAFIVSLITSGAVWMIGSDRVLAVASYDGAWAPWFGVFNRKFGTPVRVNTMSGVLSTVFLLFALNLLSGSNASSFEVILALTTSTTLLSYVMIFPTGWLLRRKHGHVPPALHARRRWASASRSARPGWCIGSWVAFVPGTLERALGFSYDYQDIWGVSFARYEAISAGIVVLIAVLTAIGYALAAPVRAQSAEIALEPHRPGARPPRPPAATDLDREARRRAPAGLTRGQFASGREALRDAVPVDDVPARVEVVRAAVLVLEVVGVLPDVDAEQRRLAGRDGVVLIGRRDDGEAVGVLDEPGPAGAELVDAGGLEVGLELVERAELGVDRGGQVAARRAAALRAHELPEERVVEVPAAVVAHDAALVLGDLLEVADDVLDRRVGPLRALERAVDPVDVGLVVLVVMDPHRLLVDVRLERRVVVGQRRNGVRHAVSSDGWQITCAFLRTRVAKPRNPGDDGRGGLSIEPHCKSRVGIRDA